MTNRIFLSACLFYSFIFAAAQQPAVYNGMKAITRDALEAQLSFLSSDWMEGREAGEKGEYLASDYIASMLQLYGIKPWGDPVDDGPGQLTSGPVNRSYFQRILLLKTVPGNEQYLRITTSAGEKRKTVALTYGVDYVFRSPDYSVELEAPVVFAGYGFIDDSARYNDFTKLDARGKYILVISGFPAFACRPGDRDRAALLRARMDARYRSMGIAGVLEFDPGLPCLDNAEPRDFNDLSPAEHSRLTGRPHYRYTIPGNKFPEYVPRIQISAKAANEILSGSGTDTDVYRLKADKNINSGLTPLSGKYVSFGATVKTSGVAVRNVIGILEGRNPGKYIVIGAHYDHLGSGNGMIWNGADDNGSGTAGVLTMAKAAAATGEKPEYSIVFALWTAEEEGLLGSRYWVRHLPFPAANILVNLNYDMISRYISDDQPKRVTMTYTAAYPRFREITASNLLKHGIDLDIDYQPSSDPPGGTDHRSFVEAGIPVIRFKPGHREEYHTAMDEVSTVNWDIMEKIVKTGFADAWELANGAGEK